MLNRGINAALSKLLMPRFVLTDGAIINVEDIRYIDISKLDSLEIEVHHTSGAKFVATKIRAIDILMQLKPSALEGNTNIKWERHTWALHNLIGHPAMQLLAFAGLHELAIKVHDITVPKPKPIKDVSIHTGSTG